MAKQKNNRSLPFDKYQFYQWAVQSPEVDVEFLLSLYQALRLTKKKGKKKSESLLSHGGKGGKNALKMPLHLREDFCGTALLCATWLKQSDLFTAEGFDIDKEPVNWGVVNNFEDVEHWPERMTFQLKDVREKSKISPDIRIAQNFSYCVFKKRQEMKDYLQSCFDDISDDGLFVMDIHGGSESFVAMEEEKEIEAHRFSYFWDQDEYYPITGEVIRKIHFQETGKKKYTDVFVYDWRMWTIPELFELLEEVGFAKVICYWEGTDEDGVSGNGIFTPSKKGSNDLSWVSYIVALK